MAQKANPLAHELRAYRERRGLTQAALAARWDMRADTLARWEQGRSRPNPEGPIRRLMALDELETMKANAALRAAPARPHIFASELAGDDLEEGVAHAAAKPE